MDEVVLLHEVQGVLCRAFCEWGGVPLAEAEVGRRTREVAAMIDGAGAIGPRNWRGLLLRQRSERWGRDVVARIRTGALEAPEGSAAHVIAWHREPDGELLSAEVAAVELLNLLPPTVAVAHFVIFAALALHEHPAYRQKLAAGDDEDLERFVRFGGSTRCFPAVGCVRNPFDWRGRHFANGTSVLLDLYGTNHDARIWAEPESFRPERFGRWDESAFDFIPRGGGDFYDGHRCAGEWITIELMKTAGRLLTSAMDYDVPEQDLRISLSRVPTMPKSNFVIPMMIGAKDLAFPKLNLASWYVFMLGGLFTLYALIAGGVDTGWTFYTPYSTMFSNSHVTAVILGVFIVGFSSIFTGINFIVTIHKMRAPGMTWFRLPLFIWTHYATSLILVLATPVLGISIVLVAIERVLGVGIFDPSLGGDPLLFQHLFWFYSHPAVYIMILPAMGVVSELVTAFSRTACSATPSWPTRASRSQASASWSGATTCSSPASRCTPG